MTKGNPRLWAILTVLAGIAVVAVSVMFAALPEVVAGQPRCYARTPPVIAFEFARTVAEASALFGDGDCRQTRLTAMDAINHLDIIGYIPAYTLFAVFGAIFAARGGRPRLALLAILAAIGAFAADMVETTTLLAITRADMAAATDAMTVRASTAAWTKFGLLAVYAALMVGVCLRASPRRWIVGLVFVLPVLGTIAAAVDKSRLAAAMMQGTTIAWMVMLLFAAKESIWPAKGA